ncbi:sugar dehydrogenase complex small subunit [Trinickia dinghuensis]|uniref:Sorbitol dehydrogenase n=1 Tax=Trinickia dinghuensis TaxID=2291023 RepID=A0A3D8JPZ9_9BURK|nr:sugar dehydrogenase complex small subunit [Trinickia dinghuensis]RDU95098.1 sorbitol dehydrogenase [Trinickia dinghuensis]
MTDARTGRPREAEAAAARRQFLLGAGASAAALAFTAAIGLPLTASRAFAFAPPAGGGLDAFTALSQQLTGRPTLDAMLASRIYDGLSKADSAFVSNVAALNKWLATHAGVPSDTVTAALAADDPRLAKTVERVVRAWYLGLVGDMPMVHVVAYEHALMFDPVNDILTIPSYCRDVPFYWAQKPAGV